MLLNVQQAAQCICAVFSNTQGWNELSLSGRVDHIEIAFSCSCVFFFFFLCFLTFFVHSYDFTKWTDNEMNVIALALTNSCLVSAWAELGWAKLNLIKAKRMKRRSNIIWKKREKRKKKKIAIYWTEFERLSVLSATENRHFSSASSVIVFQAAKVFSCHLVLVFFHFEMMEIVCWRAGKMYRYLILILEIIVSVKMLRTLQVFFLFGFVLLLMFEQGVKS